MNNQKYSRALFVSSMAVFGTIAVFIRNIPLPSSEIALYRALLAAALIGVFLLFKKRTIPLKKIKKSLPALLLSGVAMGINWILLFEAYNYTSVSSATLSYYFAPVLVTIVSPFFFRERLSAKQIICFVMSTLGIVLITGLGKSSEGSSDILGIALGLGAATFYATVIILNKFIKDIDGITRTFLQFIAAIVTLIPYVAFTCGINVSMLDTKGLICLLILGIIHTGIAYCMYFSSLKDMSGQKVAILSYIDPVVAVIISVFFLHEEMSVWQCIGGAMILGFTLWNELTPNSKE